MGLFAKSRPKTAPAKSASASHASKGSPRPGSASPLEHVGSTRRTLSVTPALSAPALSATSVAGSSSDSSSLDDQASKDAESPLQEQAARLGLPSQFFTAPSNGRVELDALSDRLPLGSGEFCTVQSATLRGERVALKLLRPAHERSELAVSDLCREIAALSHIREQGGHPSIVRLVAHGSTPAGAPFCALALFTQPLSAALPTSKAQRKQWPTRRGIDIGLQLAGALQYCHDCFMPGYRLLHRDIKPSNVGLAGDGRVVLADFGLLKIWKRGEDDNERRNLTSMTGSLRYMAPEVALSQPYNHKAEVFSFTSLLYQLLAHQKPFAWMNAEQFLGEVCRGGTRCPLGKAWPAELRALITAGWAADAESRPDIGKVAASLEELAAKLGASASPSTLPPRRHRAGTA
mmetsp:Transcript_13365/g.44639  ORF Transcript_13365/g.44639 Transcript_13365/m.44639 type:complete len:405 (-) Transcript_13365:38-1252(-)